MKTSGCTTLLYLYLVAVVVRVAHGYVIKLDEDKLRDNVETVKHRIRRHSYETSVHHFATHDLCSHYNGQKYFYQVMKSKLCEIKGQFVADLVIDMCTKNDHGVFKKELFEWVRILFDINDDGYINYFEKKFYDV